MRRGSCSKNNDKESIKHVGLPRKEKINMSEKYFNGIYKKIFKRVSIIARKKYGKKFNHLSYRDFVQIGLCRILDMKEGYHTNIYINRATIRMIDYYRYWKRRKDDEDIVSDYYSDYLDFLEKGEYDEQNAKGMGGFTTSGIQEG